MNKSLPPLPRVPLAHAGYWRDMRELADYSIGRDAYRVRYDWVDDSGAPMTFNAPEILSRMPIDLSEVLASARAACLAARGIE